MKRLSKSAFMLFTLILALVLSPISTVFAINYEAQINIGFPPGTLLVGESTILTIDILNENPFILENTSFTNSLVVNSQTGLEVHPDGVLTNTCGGVVIANPGDTTISLSGGTVPAFSAGTQGKCTITVSLLATSPGPKQSYIPSYGDTTWGGVGLHATARGGLDTITNATRDESITTLTVNAVDTPSMDKNFTPSTVWAGESTQLEINLTNNDEDNSLTGATYTDTLPSPFVVSSPLTTSTNGCGSGTINTSVGSNTITLENATIAPDSNCRIRVGVVSSTQATYMNIIPAGPAGTGSLQTDQFVTNETDVSAPVNVQSVGIMKRFSPDSFAQGDTSILTITLQNPSSTTYTNMSIDDTLPDPLVVTGSYDTSQCGGTVSVSGDNKTISLVNGVIPTGNTTTPGTCTIQVTVTSPVDTDGHRVTNVIPAEALDGSIKNLLPASDDVEVVKRTILVSKSFSDIFIVENDTTTLTILLRNQATTAYTGVTFTDTMPADLFIVGTPTASSSCGTTAVVTSDGTSLTLTNGVIPGGSVNSPGTCTITATVTSSVVNTGGYTNTINSHTIHSDQGIDNDSGDTSVIRVYPINGNAVISKSFSAPANNNPPTILTGDIATLRISITSPRDTGLNQIHLIDNLPGDMVVAASPTTNTCGGTLNAVVGSQLIELTNGTITNPNASCTINVPVTAYTSGMLTNSIPGNSLTTYEGRTEPITRSANLYITNISMTKQFSPDVIAPGGMSLLTIFLRNDNLQPITDVSLSDVLSNMDYGPDGYTVRVYSDATHQASTDCGLGEITADNGATSFSMINGTIPPSDGVIDGLCRIDVYVKGENASGTERTRTNTVQTNNVEGILNGTLTLHPVSNTSDTLKIKELELYIDKSFFPSSVYDGSFSTLSIRLENPNNDASLSRLSFTDNMPVGMILADPVNADVGTCGGTITGAPGEGSFTFSGGYLPALSNCTVSVQVGMTVDGNLINIIDSGDVTSFEGAKNKDAEEESLTNAVGAYVLKSFDPNPIHVGDYSILSIEIYNTSSSTDLTGVGLNDNLPSGMTIAGPNGFEPDPPAISNTCGGTLTADEDDTTIELTNATILQNDSCVMEIPVTTSGAGSYENIIEIDDVSPPLDRPARDTLYVNSLSLGNRVWDDNGEGSGTANDGIRNGSEPGIDNLDVFLYQDANDDGTPDGPHIATTTTSGGGYYRFDNLAADTYIVEVEIPSGYISSGVNGGDPDTDTDNDNNGIDTSNPGYIRSNPVTLEASGVEPTDDDDPLTNPDTGGGEGINEQSNRTVDFGFYRNFSLGNRVWRDDDADGTQDAGEPGMSGVTVRLYLDEDRNNTPDGSMINFTSTDADGYYRFDNLYSGSYIVEVVTPANYHSTNNAVSTTNGNVDLDHNGYVISGVNVRSNYVTLGPDADEPTGETDPSTNPESGEAADNQSNRTVDFGFTNAYSLGNRVWQDNGIGSGGIADNGIQDGEEKGFSGVTVNLYQDSDDNGTPDGGVIATTTTNIDGYYRFDNLNADTYIVEVELPVGYQGSSTNFGDPDVNEDDMDNNGVVPGTGVIRSNPVTLGGTEPTDDDDPTVDPQTGEALDIYSNRTVDFGLYAIPLSLGDLVWVDNGGGNSTNANNGIQDSGEPGLAGVTVILYRESDLTNPLAITETNVDGNYLFSNLAEDDYRVTILIPTGYIRSSIYSSGTPTNPANLTDNDATNLSGSNPQRAQSATIELTNNDLSIDFGLIEYASLGDRVWYDTNRDGIQDAGENGVPDVTVNLYYGTLGSGTHVATTTTSGGGYYLFDDLSPRDNYYVEFTLPANYNFSPNSFGTASTDSDVTTLNGSIGRTVNIELEAFEDDLTWDAGIYQLPASIGDLVWYDTNRDGIQDVGESGASGIRVDLFRPGYGADGIENTPDDALSIANQLTDGSGNYLFNELLPGTYSVSFTAPEGYAFSPQNQGTDDALDSDADRSSGAAVTTTLDAGENDMTWDAGLYQLASIGDFVWLDQGAGTPANAYNGIQDAGELGIGGVTVNLYDSSHTLIASSSTASDGSYLFKDLEPGDYYVEFIPPLGYSISPKDNNGNDATDSDADPTSGQTDQTTLDAGENDMTWDAGLYQYASIGDFVWDDNGAGGGTARDGIQDSGETGVAGITVTLFNGSGTQIGSPTTTDVNGYYEFTELLPGDYFVVFSDLPSGYEFSPQDSGSDNALDSDANTTTSPGQTVVTTLSPGENDVTWDAGIHMQTAEIGDYVWYDADGDGVQEVGENPASNVEVTLFNASGTVVATQNTDSNGNYLFTELNPGYYYLEFTAPTGYNYTLSDRGGDDTADSDAIIPNGRTNMTQLSPGESDLTWDAGLYTNATLGNWVWEDWNMDGIQDTDDTGINGVTVNLYHNTLGFVASTTTADFSGDSNYPGYYLFGDLVPGEYYVVFDLPADHKFTSQNSGADDTIDSDADASTGQTAIVVLGSGDSNLTLDAGMVPLFSVGNRVWFDTDNGSDIDTGELGVAGVTVQLYDSTGTTEITVGPDGILGNADDAAGGVTTDASGHYLFSGLLAGNYMIVLPESNFTSGGVLENYYSTGTSRNDSGVVSETTAAAANSNVDSDDNGTLQSSGSHSGAVISSIVGLGGVNPAAEPIGETDLGSAGQGGVADNYGNMTVDFGFYTTQLGNLVWNDANNSGTVDSEAGIDGVTVELWSPSGSTALSTTTTAGGGLYSFENLPAGNYFLRIPHTEFEGTETLRDFRSSTGGGSEPGPSPDTDTDDNDDNGTETGSTLGLGGYVQTSTFAMTPGSEGSVVNASGLTLENRVDLGLRDAPQVDLAITKDDGQDFYISGTTLTYTIEITNNGPADVTGAEVTDTRPSQIASWSWACVGTNPSCTGGTDASFSDFIDLDYGESLTYTVTAIVSSDPASTPLVNTAEIAPPTGTTDTDNTNNSASDTDQPASITIEKTDGVDLAAPGSVLTYHVTVTNNGSVDLDSLTITDTLPDDVTFVRAYQGTTNVPPTSIVGNVLTWDTSSLIDDLSDLPFATIPADNNIIEFDIEVEVIASPTHFSLTNTIEVEDTNTGANDSDDDTDYLMTVNLKSLTNTSEADSGTGTIVDPEPVFIGEALTYTINIEIPPGSASDLQALDIMDRGLAFARCTSITTTGSLTTNLPGGDFNYACTNPIVAAEPLSSLDTANQGRRVTFDLGDVSNSGSSTEVLTIVYQAVVLDITDNYNGVDGLNNYMTWSWDTTSSISASATPVTIDEPELTIVKTAQPTVAAYGTPIDFTLEISHAAISSAPAYDVILTDVLPAGLQYIDASITTSGLAPTSYNYDAATYTLTFNWDRFPLAETSTINFQAAFVGPSPVENEASVEWTSIEIDPQPNGDPESLSPYNIHATERWYDPLDQTINDYGTNAAIEIRIPSNVLPLTGFIPDVQTVVPAQPAEKTYYDLETMVLEIPKLGIEIPVMGIPYVDEDWDLTWLSDEAGYLEGTTFPGQVGNTALTAHVVLADGTPGPFHELNTLAWGDQIILHMDGQKYIYELRHNLTVYPNDYSTFYYDGYTWLTLITCDGYNDYTNTYDYRTLVKAVLIKTELE